MTAIAHRLRASSVDPKNVVGACALIATALAWWWLSAMAQAASATVGWLGWMENSDVLRALAALCVPVKDDAAGRVFLTSLAMWSVMAVAMMLPSALPMLRTYGEIAQTARERLQVAPSTAVIVAGYLAAWLAAAVAFAGLQTLLHTALAVDPVAPVPLGLGALFLLGAGAYQFTELREACLQKCRNPFTILFARFRPERAAIFRLGVEQGVFCIGCCWALMLVMLVVGTMNLAWMAVLTIFTVLEKTGTSKVTSRISGGILLAWGAAMAAASAYTQYL